MNAKLVTGALLHASACCRKPRRTSRASKRGGQRDGAAGRGVLSFDVIVRQRVRPKAGPMTGSGGRSISCEIMGSEGWIPRLRGI